MQDDPAGRVGQAGGKVVKVIVNVEVWGRDNKVPWIWIVQDGKDLMPTAPVQMGMDGCKVGFPCPNGMEW